MARMIVAAALAGVVGALALPAQAGLSNSSFSYTGGNPDAVVTLKMNGATTVLATRRGWVAQDGDNNYDLANNLGLADGNYIVGVCGSSDSCRGDDLERNNYFTFDLANFDPVQSAVLSLYQPLDAYTDFGAAPGLNGFISFLPSHTYTLWDADSDLTLDGVSIYNDLKSGISFGDATLTAASNGTFVNIVLNAAGLNAINSAIQNGGAFQLGGSLNFPGTGAVPEPATWATMLAGFGLVGVASRRRARAVAA
jgi:hypothetical protein